MKSVFVALLVGILGATFQTAGAVAFKVKVLHSFCNQFNCTDGASPSSLIDVNGVLYGTTVGLFFPPPVESRGCCGTVFSLDPSTGAEKVVYYFCSKECKDGSYPSSLIELNGTLYGTTFEGGAGIGGQHDGTAFGLDPNTGVETVLYSFCHRQNCVDGSHPTSLIAASGVLYGTTETGGTGDFSPCPGCGTAFSIDPSTGAEKVLYSFCSQKNCPDGSNPNPGMIDVNGTLYGVTIGGGAYDCGNGQACGTVFSLNPNTGVEIVLHSFGNGSDGKYPEASLIAVNGILYGTTYAGGVTSCAPFGCGAVFSLDPSNGTETVLYSFCSQRDCTDGANPFASLLEMNGTLYGTSASGGANGDGTVFSLDLNTGVETVLHSFCDQQNCADGANPSTGLLIQDGKFYGTTSAGGAHGGGTVYVLTKKR